MKTLFWASFSFLTTYFSEVILPNHMALKSILQLLMSPKSPVLTSL